MVPAEANFWAILKAGERRKDITDQCNPQTSLKNKGNSIYRERNFMLLPSKRRSFSYTHMSSSDRNLLRGMNIRRENMRF